MKANYIPAKIQRPGKPARFTLNPDCPFEAENDFEEALLFYLHKISNSVEDLEAATTGELDNAVVEQLDILNKTLSVKLDAVIEELRLARISRGPLADIENTG